jgi:nucleotide-binding universal stress UspA family protein
MTEQPKPAGAWRTIVVGIDGSAMAQRALIWAAEQAVRADAELVALHVLTYDHELASDSSVSAMTNWRRRLRADVAGPWTERARAAGAKVRTVVVEDDSTAGGLLRAADKEHADLIVLGAHGRGRLADRLLGATTYVVTHRARTPVVIIPTEWVPASATAVTPA